MITLPAGRGGWWHRYVCPAHGVELCHDGLTDGQFPTGGARCPYGCRIDTEEVRGAWRVLAHQACAREIRRLARSGALDEASALLEQYAQRYAALESDADAEGWMLGGRLFQQALTEAIWAVTIGEACRLTGAGGSLRAALAGRLTAAREELLAKGDFASNYTAWLNAAGAVCTGDPEWLTGPAGVHAHIMAGTGADGWEWEGSTYYHAFVLRAYLLALKAVPEVVTPEPVLERLRAMAGVLATLAPAGAPLTSADLPALHDGPYLRVSYDGELEELSELIDELVPGKPQPRPVTVYRDAGYAVLRVAGLRAIVDFGPHGGSHGHLDKLALYLYSDSRSSTPWQPDPGQVPYGHPDWRAHYASTAAHPTFSVDGLEQVPTSGELLHAGPDGVEVGCSAGYPGVSARRRLTISGDTLIDELTVTCDRPRRVTAQLRPDVPLRIEGGDVTRTRWVGVTSLRGEHTASVPAWFVARPGPGPADDPQRARTWVDWTAPECAEVTFRSVYTVER